MFYTLLGVLAALYLAISIGANDETLAPLAGSGAISLDSALLAGAVTASLGAVLLGSRVEETIGEGLLNGVLGEAEIMLVLICVALFLTVASFWGLPVSTTHSTVGAVIGVGLANWGLSGVQGSVLIRVSAGWIVSPLIGVFGAFYLNKLLRGMQRRWVGGLMDDLKLNRWSSVFLFFWVCLTEFSRGGNDVANVTAFLVPLGFAEPFVVRLVTGVGLAVGLVFIGRRVVQRVGVTLVKVDPVSGLATQMVVSLTLLGGTLLGLPISGTHVLVGALLGLGVSEKRYVDIRGLREISVAWVGTFMGTFLLAYLGFNLFT